MSRMKIEDIDEISDFFNTSLLLVSIGDTESLISSYYSEQQQASITSSIVESVTMSFTPTGTGAVIRSDVGEEGDGLINQTNDGGSPDPQSGGEKNPSDVYSGFPGDGRIHVINEYKGDVYFKPEGDLNLNDFEFKNDGAYKMGTQCWIPLDGINVNGKVYKISDGYSNIRITETGEVKVLYSGLPGQLHYWFLGGEKSSPPDPSWNNLFNVNK